MIKTRQAVPLVGLVGAGLVLVHTAHRVDAGAGDLVCGSLKEVSVLITADDSGLRWELRPFLFLPRGEKDARSVTCSTNDQ